ncbi:MAG TPA: hypothetical protein VEK11_24450 [Thermoanaerobaculia bacterium]|nr:hypothetical protein [Thermoanaerobaculia bacterium]
MGAILLLAILIAPAVIADDELPRGTEPPQARIGPPTGVTSQARIGPPTAEESKFFELFWFWLQVRIGLSIG